MSNLTYSALATLTAIGIAFSTPGSARAQGPADEQRTIVTFNEPVEIPNRVLPAGTYIFQVAEPVSSQNIIQIYDQSGQHMIGTVLSIADYRLKPTGKPVIMFDERPSGQPEAVRGWFYPGTDYGHEFVYPHARAMQLARMNHTHVLSMRDGSAVEHTRRDNVDSVGPDGQNGSLNDAVQSQR